MPGNESVTDNMKSFVGGVALKQAFYNIKTYNAQAISTAITNHNADAAHRHLPAVPTTSPPTGTFSYLTNSQTPAWSTLPTSDAVNSSSSSQLATSKAVSTLNTNLSTLNTTVSNIPRCYIKHYGTNSGTTFSFRPTWTRHSILVVANGNSIIAVGAIGVESHTHGSLRPGTFWTSSTGSDIVGSHPNVTYDSANDRLVFTHTAWGDYTLISQFPIYDA